MVLLLLGNPPERAYRLIAASFVMSWAGDAGSLALGGSWAANYVTVPIQMWLVLAAVAPSRLTVAAALGVVSIGSAVLTFPGPEILVMATGSLAAVLLVRGPICWPVYSYYGAGTLFFMLGAQSNFARWPDYEAAYQASRIGAFLLFIALVMQRRTHAVSR